MNQNREPRIGLSSAEEEDVVHYRAVSRVAIASLVLGILSAAAIFSRLMWCVPIVGVTLAVVALRTISRNQAVVLGRKAAHVGLVLSLFFLVSATTGHLLRQRTLFREARPHISKWIEMVREGRLREAHQLHLPQAERQHLGANLQSYYEATRTAKDDKDGFFDHPPLSKIVELGQQGQLHFQGNEEASVVREAGKKKDVVAQCYAIDYQVDHEPQTLPFLVTIVRVYNSKHGEARWHVQEVTEPDSPGR